MCFSKDFPSTSMCRLKSYTVSLCYRGCLPLLALAGPHVPPLVDSRSVHLNTFEANSRHFLEVYFCHQEVLFHQSHSSLSFVCGVFFFNVRITQNIRTILEFNIKFSVVAICLCSVICKFSTKSLCKDRIYKK